MRLVELCSGVIGPSHKEPASPQNEKAMVAAILQRGIWVLEFARTLVARSSAPGQPMAASRHASAELSRHIAFDRSRGT
jgi:hypothetical protein